MSAVQVVTAAVRMVYEEKRAWNTYKERELTAEVKKTACLNVKKSSKKNKILKAILSDHISSEDAKEGDYVLPTPEACNIG